MTPNEALAKLRTIGTVGNLTLDEIALAYRMSMAPEHCHAGVILRADETAVRNDELAALCDAADIAIALAAHTNGEE